MFRKGSRYTKAVVFTAGSAARQGFKGTRPRTIGTAGGVLEHTLKEGERLDLLARYYYNDPHKWWRILDANPELLCGCGLADPRYIGRVILIPQAEEQA